MKFILPIIVAFLCVETNTTALTRIQKISNPEALSESLEIIVKPSKRSPQLNTVRILYRPYEPEIYRGRQKAFAVLELTGNGQLQSRLPLQVTKDKDGFRCRFELHASQFANAQLTLSTQLYERDGHPTVGGGEVLEIELTHFLTDETKGEAKPSQPR